MFLAIEIGGTKLQLAVWDGEAEELLALERLAVEPQRGADGIRQQLAPPGRTLIERFGVRQVGIGFGGPVDEASGHTIKSHQIDGWDDFDLAGWCYEMLGAKAVVGNDADLAALAEAHRGAGHGYDPVLYVTVGTGVGGGLVVGGRVYRGGAHARTEIGHLRPGLVADAPEATVESIASGWGIAAAVQSQFVDPPTPSLRALAGQGRIGTEQLRQQLLDAEEADERDLADLHRRADGYLERITARMIAEAAAEGNDLARRALARACQALGWGIAQAITLLAPQVVVVGGGVSLAGNELFFAPLCESVASFVFPPLADRYTIRPAQLGEEVVLWGALILAQQSDLLAAQQTCNE